MSGLAENEPAKPKDPLLSIALSHGFSSNFCQLEVLPPASPLRRQVADHIDLAAPGVMPAQGVDQVGDRKTLRTVEAAAAADVRTMPEAAEPHREEVPARLAEAAGTAQAQHARDEDGRGDGLPPLTTVATRTRSSQERDGLVES